MNPTNLNHIPLPVLREMFNATLDPETEYGNIAASQLDISLNTPDSHFRLLHHILIASYSKVTIHHRDKPIPLIGLDIETNYKTGVPMLLGYSYPDGHYERDYEPTLKSLYLAVCGVLDNSEYGTGIAAWGNLDLNEVIRLFAPTPDEQHFISKGYGGRFRDGIWKSPPPVSRMMHDGAEFCIDHYISSRSLRLCVVRDRRIRTLWIYNISQFFPTRIAETATALGFNWRDFESEHPEEEGYSHLIDWGKFDEIDSYRKDVLNSNKQDADSVRLMGNHIQNIFHEIFDAYPSLLVSAGSLADACVSKMLSRSDYESNSWQYLKYSTFGVNDTVRFAESLISEAYSAGYVDQYSIGYHPEAFTADISSAYPHKIRQLPDLRECYMIKGSGPVKQIDDEVFTVVYRGMVTIPEELEYHPITVKTANKQNIRPLGTFRAAYYQEERDFCIKHGATFEDEVWVIFALKKRKLAPIAGVSSRLAQMREEYRHKLKEASGDEYIFYDSLQETVKVVDNSLYGKNVMATEIITRVNGKPEVIGLKAGDRYNQLYGGWITALTRTQIAEACMSIQASGGSPLLAMTDAVYWTGTEKDLPADMVSYHTKEAGFFEPPEKINDFYLVKTGQYEYRKGKQFYHKLRGLNLTREDNFSSRSFFRRVIKEWLKDQSPYLQADEVLVPVNTRKLNTIGMPDLDKVGLVSDGVAVMKPFILSEKQVERYMVHFRKCLDGAVRLKPAVAQQSSGMDSPLEFLSGLNEQGGNYVTRHERKRIFYLLIAKITGLSIRNRFRGKMPPEKKRLTDISWKELEEWSGIKREWAHL